MADLATDLRAATRSGGLVVALTGAGISAESGIPTFRGEEGYWTVGSSVYHPQEMATNAAFRAMPREVWRWYLYRRNVCRAAAPNAAHRALVDIDAHFGDRFRLLTQNVDGLHLRAGSSEERTYQIHGNIDYMRCAADCCTELWPVPAVVDGIDTDHPLDDDVFASLCCPRCDAPSRPHVLWFDECYDEPLFRFDSSLRAAAEACAVIIIGSSASTNLPNQVVRLAAHTGAVLVDVNIDDNPFARVAESLPNGHAVRGAAASELPAIADILTGADASTSGT